MRQILICVAIVSLPFTVLRTQDAGILKTLPEEELSVVEAIALYPAAERSAVLTMAMYPAILVRMKTLREKTESQFLELIGDLAEKEQNRIYNLSRYPELIEAMCDRKDKRSNKEMNELLQAYPEEIHADAREVNSKYFTLLKEVHALDASAIREFDAIVEPYPEDVRMAAVTLSHLPAVMSVLTDNLSSTILLGDIYDRNPGQLEHELDSLSIVLAEQQARDVAEWKSQLESNPEAKAEFEQAARDFAGEETYDDDVYSGPIPDRYREEVYVDYVWRPYSYWFGWPYWYDYAYWYPYPWWYHWGFYYGPGGGMVIFGMPSTFYFNWYFGYDPHMYHYPHCTDAIYRHYYGPRTTGTRVQPVLRNWVDTHRQDLPADWWKDDGHRVERIKEYGQFKLEYGEAAARNPVDPPTTREFLARNADRYPTLKPVLKEKQPEIQTRVPAQPRPTTPATPARKDMPRTQPSQQPADAPRPPRQETIDRARQTHQDTWQPVRRPAPTTAPAPPPRTSTPRQAPAKTAPPRKG